MNRPSIVLVGLITGSLLIASPLCPSYAQPESSYSGSVPQLSPKTVTVAKYLESCRSKPAKDATCEKLRKDAIVILQEDLRTLGSSADRGYLLSIVPIFQSEEVALRIAAADAIGMIGPQDRDVDFLGPAANDPVPDVRAAVAHAIGRGKGPALSLLAQRTMSKHKTGLTPEVPPDAGKLAMPVAPDSTYLFYASDVAVGRLSYVSKGIDRAAAFYKGKARRGPYKFDEFQDRYRYQLQDELEALDQAMESERKKLEEMTPPDPTNIQAFSEYMHKMQSVTGGRSGRMVFDVLQPELFGSPTVYVLEERQIGKRSYPTKYVVLYQDQALRKPGYRLSWMTVPDDAIRKAQVTSLGEEQEELVRKKEDAARKKRETALEELVKKKDEEQKKTFKKGQDDLEKELGF